MYSDRCLFWEQGTLLQPQHFQLLTTQAHTAATLFAQTLSPHPWGVRRLVVREDALALQTFAIDALDMVLPGGEHVILGTGRANAVSEARQFTEHWPNTESPLQVWLGLAPLSASHPNARDPQNPTDTDRGPTRFVLAPEPEAVPDLYSTGPQADVHFMAYELHILFDTEKERLETMPAVPIARLERDGEHVRLIPSYSPPCLDIHASPVLLNALRAVRNTLVARASQLADAKILPGTVDDTAPLTPQSLGLYAMLGVLSRHAPLTEHLCETPTLHPWTAYGLLRQIVGELSMFSADISPLGENEHGERVLPPYNHTELGPCFEAARAIIARIVETFVVGPAHTFPLEYRMGQWFCALPPSVCGSVFRFWLLVRNTAARPDLAAHIARRAKLATATLLPDLVTRSLPGVRLLPVEQPPAGLPRRADTLYFAVDQSDPLWNAIMTTGDPALFIPELPPETAIHLALIHR